MKTYPVVCGRHFGRFHITPLFSDKEFLSLDEAIACWRNKFPVRLVGVIDENGVFLWRLFPILHTEQCIEEAETTL